MLAKGEGGRVLHSLPFSGKLRCFVLYFVALAHGR
jgi:hypothetical protein